MDVLSVVVPCFNEQAALPIFYNSICQIMPQLPQLKLELILVNDGSCDGTLLTMRDLAQKDERVKYLSFSRNFGKEAAMFAGFEHCTGQFVAVMDVDGQDPAGLLPHMFLQLCQTDCDCVATRRVNRKGEPPIRSFFARVFYRLINKLSKTEIVDGARDFRLMKRQMVQAILSLKEYNRFSKGIFGWVGFDTQWMEYENVERVAGETKWSFGKLLLYSIEGIVAFSTAPLALSSVLGLVFCVVAFAMIVLIVAKTLIFGDPVGGWPSTVSIVLMAGGLQLFCLGVVGQYMAKTYLETKKRPIYILKESSPNTKDKVKE